MNVLNKEYAREVMGAAGQQYQQTKRRYWADRANLIDKIEIGKQHGLSQQEMADLAGLSRQRVAQFLKERRENKEPREW